MDDRTGAVRTSAGFPARRQQPHAAPRALAGGAVVLGATTFGAVTLGAVVGALAIGAIALRRFSLRRARTRVLTIDQLVVNRLIVRQGMPVIRESFEPVGQGAGIRRGLNGNGTRPYRHAASSMRAGDDAPAGTAATGEQTCPVCGGAGLVDSQRCTNCDGTGKITQGIGGA